MSTDAPEVAVVIAGGESRRMGRPKALLRWRGRTLVEHVVSICRSAGAKEVFVVTSEALDVPSSVEARVFRDSESARGPLAAIRDGLQVAREVGERAFVTSVDLPFLSTKFIASLSSARPDGAPTRAPVEGEFPQPLAAIYETSLFDTAARLLSEGKSRPLFLLQEAGAEFIDLDEIDDPNALRNCNTPERYLAALEFGGQSDPCEIEFLGLSRTRNEVDTRTLPPTTLRSALETIEKELGVELWRAEDTLRPEFLASMNGRIIGRTLDIPIGPGERVTIFDAAVGG